MSGASGQDLHTLAKLGGSGFAKQKLPQGFGQGFLWWHVFRHSQCRWPLWVRVAEGLVLEEEKDLPVILPEAWVGHTAEQEPLARIDMQPEKL